MKHPNFYENLAEANLRLRGTVVLYNEEPYYVLTVTDHLPGAFRAFLLPLFVMRDPSNRRWIANLQGSATNTAIFLETLKGTPSSLGTIRKKMSSRFFNKFRPFPLGMVNDTGPDHGIVAYVQRRPTRPRTEQGLTDAMLEVWELDMTRERSHSSFQISTLSESLERCIRNDYPLPEECLLNLLDESVINVGAAFHRDFALVRGPIDTLFLAYKQDIVGILPKNDFSLVKIGKKFSYCEDVIEDLQLFSTVENK